MFSIKRDYKHKPSFLPLPRFHLLEIHEEPFCPAFIRTWLQDVLVVFWTGILPLYSIILPDLWQALEDSQCSHITDVCSGSGGPVCAIVNASRKAADYSNNKWQRVTATLTDLFPNTPSWEKMVRESNLIGIVTYSQKPVDATNRPSWLRKGFRTMFLSFHHFKADMAKAMLQDAVNMGEGMAVFEMNHRSLYSLVFFSLRLISLPLLKEQSSFSLFLSFFFKKNTVGSMAFLSCFTLYFPFQLSSFLFYYVLTTFFPICTFVITFDGLVSCLRAHTAQEVEAMVSELEYKKASEELGLTYEWRIGYRKAWFWPSRFV